MRLFRRGGSTNWYARLDVGGRTERWSTGTADRDEAERLAQERERQLNGAAQPSAAQPSAPSPAAPSAAQPSAAQGDTRGSAIADKLRALGRAAGAPPLYTAELPQGGDGERAKKAGAPAAETGPPPARQVAEQPDKVIPPGETDDDQGDAGDVEEEGEDDGKADDLFAEVLAHAVVTGTVRVVTKKLAARRPPERPGEPHEKSLEWYHEGLTYRFEKIMGSGRLGPNGKLVLGCAGVVLSMYMGSTPMEPAAAAAAAPSSPAPAPAAAAPTDDDAGDVAPARALAHGSNGAASGRFR